MKTVVRVKHVPDPTGGRRCADDRTVRRDGMDGAGASRSRPTGTRPR